MNIKSERLKKLESELQDLEQWQKLGLVPKKDMQKHTEEISALKDKISEEKERLRFLKESGDAEEYTAPKRPTGRQPIHEPQSLPDVDIAEEGFTDAGLEMETEPFDMETTSSGEEGDEGDDEAGYTEDDDDEDPFSDRNRWRRGVLEDPDANDW